MQYLSSGFRGSNHGTRGTEHQGGPQAPGVLPWEPESRLKKFAEM